MKDVIEYLIDEKLNEVHTSLPCIIDEIDYKRGMCTVSVDGTRRIGKKETKYPALIEVKLDNKSFGCWDLQFPRKKGDKVWVGFSEIAENEVSQERFSLNEPYIIGSRGGNYEDNGEDIILKSTNGTRFVLLGDGTIEIVSGANQMIIKSNIILKGDLIQEGKIETTGSIIAQGIIKSLTDLVAKAINFLTHKHKYIPGSGSPTDSETPN